MVRDFSRKLFLGAPFALIFMSAARFLFGFLDAFGVHLLLLRSAKTSGPHFRSVRTVEINFLHFSRPFFPHSPRDNFHAIRIYFEFKQWGLLKEKLFRITRRCEMNYRKYSKRIFPFFDVTKITAVQRILNLCCNFGFMKKLNYNNSIAQCSFL